MFGKTKFTALAAASLTLAVPSALAGYDVTTSFADTNNLKQITSISTTSNIQFADKSNFTLECDQGGSVVNLIEGDAFTGSNDPDPFNATYTLTLQIGDYDVATPGVLTFNGRITGSMSNRRSTITNQYEGAYVKSIQLGARKYTVTLLDLLPPGPAVSGGRAAFAAHITCEPTAVAVDSVTLEAATVETGGAVRGTVTLDGPAPRGGALVEVRSGNTAAVFVASPVFIPEGETSAQFAGAALAAANNVELEADWNGTTDSTTVTVGAGTGLCGDFDGNLAVDLADAVRLLRAIAGLDDLPDC